MNRHATRQRREQRQSYDCNSMHPLAIASITSKVATVNMPILYGRPLGSEADLANISSSLSKVSLDLRQTVLNVSNIRTNHSKSCGLILLSLISIATLPKLI